MSDNIDKVSEVMGETVRDAYNKPTFHTDARAGAQQGVVLVDAQPWWGRFTQYVAERPIHCGFVGLGVLIAVAIVIAVLRR